MDSRFHGNDKVTPFSLSFRGRRSRNPEPMNTDGARCSEVRVHGFPLSRE
jgi:hypothetical protein